MAGELTRREHIVSRGLLAKFVNSQGILWVYEKDRPARESRPERECAQRDFYEYVWRGQTTKNKYENWLGRIESDALPLFDFLIERRPLTAWQATIISTFVASLFLRTRKVRSQISAAMVEKFREQTRTPEFVRDLQYELFREGILHSAEDVKKNIDELRTAMEQSSSFYHVIGLPRHTSVLAETIMRKSWEVIEAVPGTSFVISDCPVTTVELAGGHVLPGVGFGKENAAVFLPLTPQHLFVASRVRWARTVDARFVDRLNRLTVNFSHRNVYASTLSAELQMLVDTEMNQIVFGQNAFVPSN
jgi:hypothetical protein